MSIELDGSDGNYDILVDGEMVGYIESCENVLTQIEVLPEYRGNGYGTRAVQQFIETRRARGAEYIETSAVISGAMESVVIALGFTRCEDDESHWRIDL